MLLVDVSRSYCGIVRLDVTKFCNPCCNVSGPMQGGPHMVPQPTMSVSSNNMHPQIHYMSHHPQSKSNWLFLAQS